MNFCVSAVSVCKCLSVFKCLCVCVSAWLCVCVSVSAGLSGCKCLSVPVRLSVCKCLFVYKCMSVCVNLPCARLQARTHAHACAHVLYARGHARINICMHARTHVCTHAGACSHACTYTGLGARMHARTSARTVGQYKHAPTCMHARTYSTHAYTQTCTHVRTHAHTPMNPHAPTRSVYELTHRLLFVYFRCLHAHMHACSHTGTLSCAVMHRHAH